MIRTLRKERFDYAVLAGAGFAQRALRLARAAGPKHIIGFTQSAKRAERHIDIGISYDRPRPMHEVEDVFRLLAPFGIEGEPPAMQVRPAPEAVARVRTALQQRGIAVGNIVGVHVSARKPSNRWSADNFVDLIERLGARHDFAFMLLWSPGSASNPRHPGDDEKAREIVARLPNSALLAYATEQLEELVAALSLCRMVVCSDGGALHIAAALSKPILCFFGKSDRSRWYPWRAEHVLLQPASLDVSDISVDEAVQGFEHLYARVVQDGAGAIAVERN